MSIVNSNNFLHKTVDGVKQFFSPLVNAATVVRKDGTRLEQDGVIDADTLGGVDASEYVKMTDIPESGGVDLLTVYPVGSIYMSINETSPASLFGGTWEQLQDRFLLGAGNSYALGSTGGEATHKLTDNELPQIKGSIAMRGADSTYSSVIGSSGVFSNATEDNPSSTMKLDGSGKLTRLNMSFGGDQPHNNMPPYLAVNMWKRVS